MALKGVQAGPTREACVAHSNTWRRPALHAGRGCMLPQVLYGMLTGGGRAVLVLYGHKTCLPPTECACR